MCYTSKEKKSPSYKNFLLRNIFRIQVYIIKMSFWRSQIGLIIWVNENVFINAK